MMSKQDVELKKKIVMAAAYLELAATAWELGSMKEAKKFIEKARKELK